MLKPFWWKTSHQSLLRWHHVFLSYESLHCNYIFLGPCLFALLELGLLLLRLFLMRLATATDRRCGKRGVLGLWTKPFAAGRAERWLASVLGHSPVSLRWTGKANLIQLELTHLAFAKDLLGIVCDSVFPTNVSSRWTRPCLRRGPDSPLQPVDGAVEQSWIRRGPTVVLSLSSNGGCCYGSRAFFSGCLA